MRRIGRQRQRATRPTSPYSTDSNYSIAPPPHKPYPKSERKRQLMERGALRRRQVDISIDDIVSNLPAPLQLETPHFGMKFVRILLFLSRLFFVLASV